MADMAQLLEDQLNEVNGEAAAAAVLHYLEEANLLHTDSAPHTLTRRQLMRQMTMVGGLAVSLPLVTSITAPTPAMAASTVERGPENPSSNGDKENFHQEENEIDGVTAGGAAATVFLLSRRDKLPLREQPRENARIVVYLAKGAQVRLLQTHDTWCRVQTTNNHIGWALANDLIRDQHLAQPQQAGQGPPRPSSPRQQSARQSSGGQRTAG
jgi:hypothetical protein